MDELRRLRVLAEVADTVTRDLSLDRQLPRLIDLITEALDAERATLFLYYSDTGELFSRWSEEIELLTIAEAPG